MCLFERRFCPGRLVSPLTPSPDPSPARGLAAALDMMLCLPKALLAKKWEGGEGEGVGEEGVRDPLLHQE